MVSSVGGSGEIRVATFDCYGTLIDWEGGAGAFLYELARRHEQDPPPGRELRERWEELQFERLQGDWRSYREILADSLAEWAGERGYRYNERDGEALARSMESWQPFPDTVPALRAAKRRGPAAVDHLEHRPGDHRALAAPPRGRVRRRDRGRGLPRLQAVEGAVRARAARDRRPARPDPARGVRLQVRHRAGAAARAADGLGEPQAGAGARARAGRLRVERPLAAGRACVARYGRR